MSTKLTLKKCCWLPEAIEGDVTSEVEGLLQACDVIAGEKGEDLSLDTATSSSVSSRTFIWNEISNKLKQSE